MTVPCVGSVKVWKTKSLKNAAPEVERAREYVSATTDGKSEEMIETMLARSMKERRECN